jgi:hypothetical protein
VPASTKLALAAMLWLNVVTRAHVSVCGLQISGLTFFMVALLGAVSVITGFLAAMYGTSAAGVYAAVTLVNSNSRLQGSQNRHGGNIRYHRD